MPGYSGRAEVLEARAVAGDDLDHLWVPLGSGTIAQHRERLIDGTALPVWPVVDQCVKGVADRDDAGKSRDRRSHEAVRVAAAVGALVMVSDGRQGAGALAHGPDRAL